LHLFVPNNSFQD